MARSTLFRDRTDAGVRLGAALGGVVAGPVVVVGLPRGGVPVAAEVAAALGAPLDVIIVRKLGAPFQPELAMGAIGEDGITVVNPRVVESAGISEEELAHAVSEQRAEVTRRARLYRGGRERVPLLGRTVVVVDDGMATGATARAACAIARAHGAARVVLAVPVAPPRSLEELDDAADEVVCLETPERFLAVGQHYGAFDQTADETVVALLRHAAEHTRASSSGSSTRPLLHDEDVTVRVGGAVLLGRLTVPDEPGGLVVLAHGSGSTRDSPRSRLVASALTGCEMATLRVDLLTREEETDRRHVFDVVSMADRLAGVTAWVSAQPLVGGLPIGYFGASTGAAAALRAAASPAVKVAAVVSRGGRPDLAGASLSAVRAPTLLIVGGHDSVVLGLNEWAMDRLRCERRLAVVAGASHLFEEPGALEEVGRLACDWFATHLLAAT